MKIKNLKLYHYPATRSARARWALHETVGDDFELERVALYSSEQYHEDYLQKNPNHNVPLLEITLDDGGVHRMLESVAIVEWLADAFPEKKLAPPPGLSRARADYLQMLHFGSSWMDMMLWQLRLQRDLLPPDERDQATISRYLDKFRTEVEPQLTARLERQAFICGDQFTAVDCVIGQNVNWARLYDLCQGSVFSSYLGALAERPAYRAAYADRALFSVSPTVR